MYVGDQFDLRFGLSMAENPGVDVVIDVECGVRLCRFIQHSNLADAMQGKLAQVAISIDRRQQIADGVS
ncbi:hypothetical protein IOMTU133_1098 [Pseudomonas aeruginosa]|nr:hypothetical protein IOMTU133_1098 [Pseudomonas aeruginosa]